MKTLTVTLVLAAALAAPRQEREVRAPAPEARTATSSDGLPIAYEVHGAGSPTLVFVHGWSCDRSFWSRQLARYAASHRVVALDLGGHGASGRGREAWSVAALVPDVVAVLEAEDLRDAVLVGHSLGGWVAVGAANAAPDRVCGVVPVDAWHNADMKLDAAAFDRMADAWAGDFEGAIRGMVGRAFFRPGADPELVADVTERMVAATTPEVAVGITRSYPHTDFARMLAALRAPIVCVNADLLPTLVETNRGFAPQFEAIVVKDSGHFLMMEQPDVFASAFDDALARVVQQAGCAAPPETPRVERLTPVLVVEDVGPSVAFFEERLGWTLTMSVPGGDGLAFAALESGPAEVMLQSRAAAETDLGAVPAGGGIVYVEVADLDAVVARVADAPGVAVVVPRRRAPHGADELGVREPGGNLVLFAELD